MGRAGSPGPVTRITFGGVPADLSGLITARLTVPASGILDITVSVPTTTPLGIRRIAVTQADSATTARNVNAPLVLSPSTAVPNQVIIFSGSSFTTVGAATIVAGFETCSAAGITVVGTCRSGSHTLTTVDR